jgi:hypothetical protein
MVYQYIDIFHSNASSMIVSYDVQLGAKCTNSYEYNDSYGGTYKEFVYKLSDFLDDNTRML